MWTTLKRFICRWRGHRWGCLKGFYGDDGRVHRYGFTCLHCGATEIVPAPQLYPLQQEILHRALERYYEAEKWTLKP